MSYYRNWMKRHAEVLSLAADNSNSGDANGLLGTQSCENEMPLQQMATSAFMNLMH